MTSRYRTKVLLFTQQSVYQLSNPFSQSSAILLRASSLVFLASLRRRCHISTFCLSDTFSTRGTVERHKHPLTTKCKTVPLLSLSGKELSSTLKAIPFAGYTFWMVSQEAQEVAPLCHVDETLHPDPAQRCWSLMWNQYLYWFIFGYQVLELNPGQRLWCVPHSCLFLVPTPTLLCTNTFSISAQA